MTSVTGWPLAAKRSSALMEGSDMEALAATTTMRSVSNGSRDSWPTAPTRVNAISWYPKHILVLLSNVLVRYPHRASGSYEWPASVWALTSAASASASAFSASVRTARAALRAARSFWVPLGILLPRAALSMALASTANRPCPTRWVGMLAARNWSMTSWKAVSYTHLRAHETGRNLVCR